MTCFWDGILSKLTLNQINEVLGKKDETLLVVTQKSFIKLLKTNVTYFIDVRWNNTKISDKLTIELVEWILDYNEENITQGHDCSICDPFLILICQLFKVNIQHTYNGVVVNYRNVRNHEGTILNFSSDSGHFWAS